MGSFQIETPIMDTTDRCIPGYHQKVLPDFFEPDSFPYTHNRKVLLSERVRYPFGDNILFPPHQLWDLILSLPLIHRWTLKKEYHLQGYIHPVLVVVPVQNYP